jgi:hypothetical protein
LQPLRRSRYRCSLKRIKILFLKYFPERRTGLMCAASVIRFTNGSFLFWGQATSDVRCGDCRSASSRPPSKVKRDTSLLVGQEHSQSRFSVQDHQVSVLVCQSERQPSMLFNGTNVPRDIRFGSCPTRPCLSSVGRLGLLSLDRYRCFNRSMKSLLNTIML